MRGVSFRISFQTSLHPQNFRISKLLDTCSRAPVSLYCGALRDYDLLTAAGKTAEAHRALHLCSAAVNNGFCLESLLLPQIRAYLCSREKSDFKIYYFLQIVRYLSSKKSPFFSDAAEKDMIDDLIEENWDEFLCKNGERLVFLSPSEKIELFGNSLIVFPV